MSLSDLDMKRLILLLDDAQLAIADAIALVQTVQPAEAPDTPVSIPPEPDMSKEDAALTPAQQQAIDALRHLIGIVWTAQTNIAQANLPQEASQQVAQTVDAVSAVVAGVVATFAQTGSNIADQFAAEYGKSAETVVAYLQSEQVQDGLKAIQAEFAKRAEECE